MRVNAQQAGLLVDSGFASRTRATAIKAERAGLFFLIDFTVTSKGLIV
jgi:hypothetical protein